uniref:Uncharacterized protein n=1 Tax=uncultured prokaryote TaxID=198431 RepID=A0A0H5QLM3_9ZZZZ|nr:hypothetical protein [uncultured prokaryote]
MPYTGPHTYVTWFGDAFTAAEEWQVGIRLSTAFSVPTTTQLEDLDAAMGALLTSANVAFPSSRRYLGLKVAPQDVNGRYPDGIDAVEYLRPAPLSGSSSGGYPQIALCLSWRTNRSRGIGSNGRMYVPSAFPIVATDGRISSTNALAAATAGAQFIADVRDAGLGSPAVMSTVGAGRTEAITGCRVGRVMDTQRRRRNQLAEEYTEPVAVPS